MVQSQPKVVIIVQARMGSTRLPGKHMQQVLGRPLIAYLFERLTRVKHANAVVLATTTSAKDDPLIMFCQQSKIPFIRGSEEDVLGRYLQAAAAFQADVIVRICGDCPLIDPAVIDLAIESFLGSPGYDMVSNVVERTYPRGMDVEVFSLQALRSAAAEAGLPEDREHVTLFFYKHPERFQLGSITRETDESRYRWTVDTNEDFRLITLLLEAVFPFKPLFSLEDLLAVAKEHPEWEDVNSHIPQKNATTSVEGGFALELVRPTEEHATIIYGWRNDVATRHASFHTQPLDWKRFLCTFMGSYFNNPSLPPLFVLEKGEPVAFLRLELAKHPLNAERKCAKISINVAPGRRGHGIGKQSLLLAKEFLYTQRYDDAYAEVKVGNDASAFVFLRAGFEKLSGALHTVFDTGEVVPIHRFLAKLSINDSYASRHVFIVAEAGSNWRAGPGAADFSIAKKLIEEAAKAGADAIKFQIFQPERIYVPTAGQSEYLAEAGLKMSMTDLFKTLAMPADMIPQLARWAKEAGIEFMATPFSPEDFAAVDPYVARHKIASYEIGYNRLITLAAQSGKPLFLSTGAASEEEIGWAVNTFRQQGGADLTLLQCTARYPAPPEAMNLRVIPWLRERFAVASGLSDHSRSPLEAPLAAVALGAVVIEKHFTLDREFEGPDHFFAITPDELRLMVKSIRALEPMLGSRMKYVTECEQELRAFARRGVQAIKTIRRGERFREDGNIAVLRPGEQPLGVHPLFLPQIEGKEALRDIPLGGGVQHGDF